MTLTYKIGKVLAKFLLAVIFRVQIAGTRKLPEGPVIVVSNHISNWDVLILGGVFDRQIHYMAKKELFKNPLLKKLMEALGAFPVDREGADITAIKTALSSVKAGQKLIIFPQGTRGAAEGETKKGAAMLAVKSRAPILPMYITEGKGFRCRATVVIGEAFTPDPKTKEYGALADDILRRIYALKEKV